MKKKNNEKEKVLERYKEEMLLPLREQRKPTIDFSKDAKNVRINVIKL